MNEKGLNKLATMKDQKGKVVGKIFGPPNALTAGADVISQSLYVLSETIIRGIMPESRGGGLGGEFGYGADFENEIFMMHHYCWCEKNDGSCLWCLHGDHPDFDRLLKEKWGTNEYGEHRDRHYYDPPNFWYKPSDFRVSWYKWIGRDMATNRDISSRDWMSVFRKCHRSIPASAKKECRRQQRHESTKTYKQEREKRMEEMINVVDSLVAREMF